MAFNFNSDPPGPLSPGPTRAATQPAASEPATVTSDNPQSAAAVRFGSCRWQQPAENGTAAFCTHREVKPYAGTQSFDPNAWCSDCQYYKLRRAPKKRERTDEYSW